MKKYRIFTILLIAINLYLGYLVSQYNWNPHIILQWGGMSAQMPIQQPLNQFPPFTDVQINASWLLNNWQGIPLLLLRATYASFLHFSWTHLINNMIVLYIMGSTFERVTPTGLIIPVYWITGIIAMLSALYFQPQVLTAGASGALFGIMGAAWVVSIKAKYQYHHQQMDANDYVPYMTLGQLSTWLIIYNSVFSFLTPNVSIVGHFAGLIAGLLMGLLLPVRKSI